MLEKIIAFSIRNKLIIGLFTLALIGYGAYSVTQLPIDAVPDITNNQVQVITVSPSLGAPDVERLITFPIEQANSNIPGRKEIRSFSRFGLSVVTIVFDDDVDIYWARQQVTERLKLAEEEIPQGVGTPSLAPVTTGLGEIYQYVVKAKPGYEGRFSDIQLRTIQDWIVRRQLLGVKGVADVSSFGGKLKQYEIAVNPAKLKAHHITISDVFNALEQNNENTGGAYIEKVATVLYIRTEGLVKTMDDIKQIVVKNLADGTPLLISDVAEVRIGHATRYGAITYNDQGEVAGAVVMMLKGENSSRVIKAVKGKIAHITKTLPEGVEIEPFLDRTKMVNSAISTVSKNLLEGALIVIFILVLFLGNFRAGIIVASIIPLSMLFAVILMNRFGVSGNLMSLGALDFGLIVDGAVIIVEAVMHKLHSGKALGQTLKINQEEMDETVRSSASRMMNSAVFGQIIILVVYLPIFTLEGIEGKMFKPMAETVAFALLGAFVLSLTYVPMMSALMLSKKLSHKPNLSDRMMDFITNSHLKYFSRVLQYPKSVIAASLVLFGISLVVFSRMGGEFIPELPEGDFAVETRVLPGSNLKVSSEAIVHAAHILLQKFPEVEKVVGKTGSGEIPTDPMPMEASDMMIILKDKSEWTSAKSWDEMATKMGEALNDVPGVTFGFQYPVAMRFNELMTGAKQDVVCKIFGENLDTLSKYSKILGNVAAQIEGAKDIYVEPIDGLPQLIITYNRGAIAQYGLNIEEVNRVVNTAFAGERCGLVFEDERRFDMVVRLAGEQRQSMEDVRNLLIPAPTGTQIPLYQLADVSIKESVNQIQRDDAKRRIIVGFNVHGRDVQSIVSNLQQQVQKSIRLPSGYYITYGGAFENLVAAQKRLSIAVPVSLLLIFLFLYFAFGSIKQGLLIYSAIPLSAIGGILLLAARGLPFSISAGVGFIALFGVAVLNGIVLLAEFNRIKQSGETDPNKIVLQGTKHRLRPVLMTAFVASLGFLPMALSHGNGAEVQRPLATVVIGGLLIATFLTLYVLPVLYVLSEKISPAKRASAIAPVALLFLLFSIAATDLAAQQPVSLEKALTIADKNNLHLRSAQLNEVAHQKLRGSFADVSKTEVTAEYGQFNSLHNDTRFGVSQSFSFPGVYVQQRKVLNEDYRIAQTETKLTEVELHQQLKSRYYQILNLREKQKLLQYADSLYAAFLQRAELRYEKGETNLLEKTTAAASRGQIANQLQLLNSDLQVALLQFNRLLNDSADYEPEPGMQKYPLLNLPDTSLLASTPALQRESLRMNRYKYQWQLERNKLAPDFSIGYNNMSLIGTQTVNGSETYFNGAKRFNSVNAGIAIPLFFGGQAAKIVAAKRDWQKAQNDFALHQQMQTTAWLEALARVRKFEQSLTYYENAVLNNAATMIETANQQLAAGQIDYLGWTMLLHQSISLKSEYTDLVDQYNQAIFELEKISGQP